MNPFYPAKLQSFSQSSVKSQKSSCSTMSVRFIGLLFPVDSEYHKKARSIYLCGSKSTAYSCKSEAIQSLYPLVQTEIQNRNHQIHPTSVPKHPAD